MLAHVDKAVIAGLKDVMGNEYPVLLEAYLADSEQRLGLAEKAVVEHDMPQLLLAIHSFKGSCGNIGALELSRLCLELEGAVDTQNQPMVDSLFAQIKTEMEAVKAIFLSEIQGYRA
ncbi:Hpt domain-containing protein [Pseudomonas sp. NPDC078700]|uniref:Hpt domain-containing protein n=1 Tax=Pseudomonas sp. NPDC078700 TaxID=3364424 RepID=UPI0037CBEBEA